MKIKVTNPIDCPLRELDGSVYTCAAITNTELVCDSEETDTFPFPDGCPLKEDRYILINLEG